MGNSIAKDFKHVKLGHGTLPSQVPSDLLAPHSQPLDKPMTVLVRRDDHRKSTIVFDVSNMLPLYITKTKRQAGIKSVTKDAQGQSLFLTSTTSKGKIQIYKAPSRNNKVGVGGGGSRGFVVEDLAQLPQDTTSGTATTLGDDIDASHHSVASVMTTATRYETSDLPVSAQIDVDHSGSSPCAFLSVVVWGSCGPKKLVPVYKAIRVPQVKFGTLVVDMEGQVVAKAFLDEKRMEPLIRMAAGADVASMVAITSALLGTF